MTAASRLMRGCRELARFGALYVLYDAARWRFVGELPLARAHADRIIDVERSLHIGVERSVQRALDWGVASWLLANVYLAAQLVVLPGALIWLYHRSPGVYRQLRNTVIGAWLLAVPIFALFPVAPPRLAGIGIAAHAALRARWARALAVLWGPLVTLAVIATGNHYVFDVVAGLLVTGLAYSIGRLGDRLRASGSSKAAAAARRRSCGERGRGRRRERGDRRPRRRRHCAERHPGQERARIAAGERGGQRGDGPEDDAEREERLGGELRLGSAASPTAFTLELPVAARRGAGSSAG